MSFLVKELEALQAKARARKAELLAELAVIDQILGSGETKPRASNGHQQKVGLSVLLLEALSKHPRGAKVSELRTAIEAKRPDLVSAPNASSLISTALHQLAAAKAPKVKRTGKAGRGNYARYALAQS